MSKSERVREARLAQIEAEFHVLLLSCLQRCAGGRWGLFGQNDLADPEGRYWSWPEAKRLKELAQEIRAIRAEFGETNPECERFLELRSLRGPNIPGEPKLAAEFLNEINKS
jgi:hypothetical protein